MDVLRKICWCGRQTYIMQWETIGCCPVYKPWLVEVGWKSWYFSVLFVIVFSMPEIILLSSAKQNIQVINILIKQKLPSYEVNIKLLTLERLFSWVPQVDNFQCSPHVKAIIVYHILIDNIAKIWPCDKSLNFV